MLRLTFIVLLCLSANLCFAFSQWQGIEELLKDQKWQQVLNLTKGSTDTEAICYHHYVRQKFYLDDPILIQELWHVPHSQPSACDHLFNFWSDKNLINEKHYFNRFLLALSHDKIRLARYLSNSINAQDKTDLALKLYHKPKLILSESEIKKIDSRLLVFAIERTAEKYSADDAEIIYEILRQKNDFTEHDQHRIAEVLSTYYALEGSHKTNYWFKKISLVAPSEIALEWQIRYQLKQRKWSKVKLIILSLPKDTFVKPVWQYWLAQSFKHTNDEKSYKKILSKISSEREFYGMLAAQELKQSLPFNERAHPIKDYETTSMESILNPIKTKAEKGHHNTSRSMWLNLLNHMDEQDRYVAAKLAQQWDLPELAIKTANTLEEQDDLTLRFPIHYQNEVIHCNQQYNIPPEIVYAIIRQESAFQKDARSVDGAMGLMQILPNTARYIAKQKRIRDYNNLLDPGKNIQIGCAYLSYLSKKFDGNLLLALAAYNMGPGNIKRYLPENKEPTLIWLETLPRSETRHYVKNLMTYKLIYEYLNKKKPSLKLIYSPIQ